MALFRSPLISPRFRATGRTSRLRPSCTASPTRSGSCRLECERRGTERLDLLSGATQRSFESLVFVAAFACLCDPLLGPFQCLFVHERKATLAIG